MFGPLGLSLAPYIRSSRTLKRWVKPVANWYVNLSGYRKMGLRYDDLREYPSNPLPVISDPKLVSENQSSRSERTFNGYVLCCLRMIRSILTKE